MATLVLETGAGLPNSNSYGDLTGADDYFASHPYYADAWADITDEQRRSDLLINASRWLDINFNWIGYPAVTGQAMGWPRRLAYDRYGFLLAQDEVPREVREATYEQAYHISKGEPSASIPGVGITDLKIDVIELNFDKSITPVRVAAPVLNLLRGLGEYAGGMRIRKVLVG